MINNGVELQNMIFNGQEVKTWILNDVEIYSGKVQLKYVITFIKDNSGAYPVNVKVYSAKNNNLLREKDFNIVTDGGTPEKPYSYNDNIISAEFSSLSYGRWTFTPLLKGTSTVDGEANSGAEYGGTEEQLVPYTQNTSCIITFVTSDAYKVTDTGLTILIQPESQTVTLNNYATFRVVVAGDDLKYQWQWRNAYNNWANSGMVGADTNTISVQGTSARKGYKYRCVITDSKGNQLISNPATLTVRS